MASKRNTQYDIQDVQWDDEEMKQRIEERRRKSSVSRRRRKALTLVVIGAVFAMLATMCGKDIVRLKAEGITIGEIIDRAIARYDTAKFMRDFEQDYLDNGKK